MRARLRVIYLTGLTLLVCCSAKGKTMDISTDQAQLARHAKLPAEVGMVRWLVAPRGVVGLGPTDLVLGAQFSIDATVWAKLRPQLGPKRGSVLSVPKPLRALTGTSLIEGEVFSATLFENIRWSGKLVWDGEALTMVLFSK